VQSAEQKFARKLPHAFRPGQSGNPRGRESNANRKARIAGIVESWCSPFGKPDVVLAPAEYALALKAAELSLCRARRHEDAVRICNALRAALDRVGLTSRHQREREAIEQPSVPSSEDALQLVNRMIAEAQAKVERP